jgi:hypothetical protein
LELKALGVQNKQQLMGIVMVIFVWPFAQAIRQV